MPPVARKIPGTMKALREAMEKKYGTRVVRREDFHGYDTTSSGAISVDLATSVGGWIRGRTVEIVGAPDSGKSTLAINSMAQAQAAYPDLAVAYIDIERTFDWDWAEANGLQADESRFFRIHPQGSEDVSDQIRLLVETGLFSMVVVDSIGAMESKDAMEKEAEAYSVGRNAQIITRMVKSIGDLAQQHQVAVLFINQHRANIGSRSTADISAGPKAFRHSTTMKVDMVRLGDPKTDVVFVGAGESKREVGRRFRARVSRSKVAPSGRAAEFWILFEDTPEYGPVGIDRADELLTLGLYHDVITKGGGGYYTLPGVDKIQGQAATKAYLREHPEVADCVREMSLQAVASDVQPTAVVSFDRADEEAS